MTLNEKKQQLIDRIHAVEDDELLIDELLAFFDELDNDADVLYDDDQADEEVSLND